MTVEIYLVEGRLLAPETPADVAVTPHRHTAHLGITMTAGSGVGDSNGDGSQSLKGHIFLPYPGPSGQRADTSDLSGEGGHASKYSAELPRAGSHILNISGFMYQVESVSRGCSVYVFSVARWHETLCLALIHVCSHFAKTSVGKIPRHSHHVERPKSSFASGRSQLAHSRSRTLSIKWLILSRFSTLAASCRS